MEPAAKGTVTPLASLFSEEDAKKAASYVEVKIGEKRVEMNRLEQFVEENTNLINLVTKLPDQLHHNVMVPFGKLAFFPGRLIHTNECLVLLGENYYTDRTSKQTVDVLARRDKTLQSQIHSLKAEIEDLQTEASFFTSTASEAMEGLVEIREEYVEEEDSSATVIQSGVKEPFGLPEGENAEAEVEDDEFARIMSRLNELEMQEEQDDEDADDKGEEPDSSTESVEESDHNMVKGIRGETEHNRIEYGKQETDISVPKKASSHSSSIREPRYSEASVKGKAIEVLPEKHVHEDVDDPMTCIGPIAQYLPKDHSRGGRTPLPTTGAWRDFQATSTGSRAMAKTNDVVPQKVQTPIQKPEPKFDTSKAFTGSIVERTHNLETNKPSQMQPPGSQPSKLVSRFMARRR